MELFNLLVGGGVQGWVVAALLVCFFCAALFKPERIRSPFSFRIASLLLALVIIAPSMVQLFVIGSPNPVAPFKQQLNQDNSTVMYALALPPLLLSLSVILGLDSVMPRGKKVTSNQSSEPTAPPHTGSEN